MQIGFFELACKSKHKVWLDVLPLSAQFQFLDLFRGEPLGLLGVDSGQGSSGVLARKHPDQQHRG